MCNETVLLGKIHNAAVIDFRVSTFTLDPYNHFCSFHVETTNTPYVGMKFLSSFMDNDHDNVKGCSFELNISGKEIEHVHYNTFPDDEISVHSHGYITVQLKLENCNPEANDTSVFQLLVFKFGDTFCFADDVKCVNSTRCVNEELTCSRVYDFCDNDFQNCKQNTGNDVSYKRYRKTGPPSVPGILLGSVCLTVIVTLLLYIIACRKRPCFQRVAQKLLCRQSSCQSSSARRNDLPCMNAAFTCETEDVSFSYVSLREPPPNYTEIESNSLEQIRNENSVSVTGSAFLYFQNGVQNIAPPCYSQEDEDETENGQHELPPSYALAVSEVNTSQHI